MKIVYGELTLRFIVLALTTLCLPWKGLGRYFGWMNAWSKEEERLLISRPAQGKACHT